MMLLSLKATVIIYFSILLNQTHIAGEMLSSSSLSFPQQTLWNWKHFHIFIFFIPTFLFVFGVPGNMTITSLCFVSTLLLMHAYTKTGHFNIVIPSSIELAGSFYHKCKCRMLQECILAHIYSPISVQLSLSESELINLDSNISRAVI